MIKNYLKSAMTRIKKYFYDSDRGVRELNDNAPFGHSGKLNYEIAWAGGAPSAAPLVVPAGFRAFVTHVSWNLTIMSAAAAAFVLRDNQATPEYISAYTVDGVSDPYLLGYQAGNGSGVIGRGQGTIDVVELLVGAGNYGTGTCKLTYYLRPLI